VKTDGTQSGTEKLADIFVYRGSQQWMLNFDDKVYFASSDGLWRTGGTSSSTERFDGRPAFGSQDGTGQFTSAGDLFYFVAAGDSRELWCSNGQAQIRKRSRPLPTNLRS
jgi:hypothetical protein